MISLSHAVRSSHGASVTSLYSSHHGIQSVSRNLPLFRTFFGGKLEHTIGTGMRSRIITTTYRPIRNFDDTHLSTRLFSSTQDTNSKLVTPPAATASSLSLKDEEEGGSSWNFNTIKTKTVDFVVRLPTTIASLPEKIQKLPSQMKTWPAAIKRELHHYWVGSKLFALEVRSSYRIIRGILNGKELTRRERKLLITTFNDMLRLVPFIVIVIIPLAEFALPVLLKVFPNMLPSTFEDKLKKEEELKKNLKARLRFAKFLQDAAEELAQKQAPTTEGGAPRTDILNFMQKVKAGEPVSNDEILQFAKAFEDELTLDNLQRPQLVAMCKYMNLNTFGGDAMLRFQLSHKLKQLKSDDMLIQKEGINSLSVDELQHALRARGMRGSSTNKLVLRRRLSEWLDLSLNHNLPASVLVLSRALVITEKKDYEDKLKETLSSLPDDLVEEVKLKIDESQGTADRDLKYEVIKAQRDLIEEEATKAEREASEAVHVPEPDAPSLQKEKLKGITEAVSVLSSASSVKQERDELRELKADQEVLKAETAARERQRKEVKEKPAVVVAEPVAVDAVAAQPAVVKAEKAEIKGKPAAASATENVGKRLQLRLDQMVAELEQEVEKVEVAVGMKLSILDKDRDGVISTEELAHALQMMKEKLPKEKVEEIVSQFDRDHDGKISLEELLAFADERHKQKEKQQKVLGERHE
eukprot:TRINITY_DN4398_c0_g1_i1.p1 TRINITY_DN4398_c0_g1~~TRINITY_DN4398_c0_g1_i1.p1  ORF type:complete len:697 (-),score=230.31 TRINITY_DN4398_c0_g1_i1:212-2302(-)